MDVVVTCPKKEWTAWIQEGVLPGDLCPAMMEFFFKVPMRPQINPGERVYVVAYGRLRGYAPLTRVHIGERRCYYLVRQGGAVAVTIPELVYGFRGFRYRWWEREEEYVFPDWDKP